MIVTYLYDTGDTPAITSMILSDSSLYVLPKPIQLEVIEDMEYMEDVEYTEYMDVEDVEDSYEIYQFISPQEHIRCYDLMIRGYTSNGSELPQ